jgi:hypothetical protein
LPYIQGAGSAIQISGQENSLHRSKERISYPIAELGVGEPFPVQDRRQIAHLDVYGRHPG